MDRLIRVYTEQKNDLRLYEEQLGRGEQQSPTAAQHAEITRLEQRLGTLRILIDAILAKSEAELGMDILSGKRWLPTVPRARPRKLSEGVRHDRATGSNL